MSLIRVYGSPGTGKSEVCAGLNALGLTSYDTDKGFCTPVNNETGEIATEIGNTREWLLQHTWHLSESKIEAIRIANLGQIAYLCGTVTDNTRLQNMFNPLSFLLMADEDTIRQRLITRDNHTFGKSKEERDMVIQNMARNNERCLEMGAVAVDGTLPKQQVTHQIVEHTAKALGSLRIL